MTKKYILLTFVITGLTSGLFAQFEPVKNKAYGGYLTLPVDIPSD